MRHLKRLLVIGVVFYLIGLTLAYFAQRSFIYRPERNAPPAGFAQTNNVEIVSVKVEGVGELKSYYAAPKNGAPVILFYHGNGGSVYHLSPQMRDFHDWGVGFLAVEYPGYGGNPNIHSEETFLPTALANFDWLLSQNINPEQIIIYGNSLGAASAIYVASERKAAALILTAPFLSAVAMGRRMMPIFPVERLLKDKFRSDIRMPLVEEPLLVLHGEKDITIPHWMGQKITTLHTGENQFILVEGAPHYMWHTDMKKHIREAVFRYGPETTP